eukprot:Pgem_evm2s1747
MTVKNTMSCPPPSPSTTNNSPLIVQIMLWNTFVVLIEKRIITFQLVPIFWIIWRQMIILIRKIKSKSIGWVSITQIRFFTHKITPLWDNLPFSAAILKKALSLLKLYSKSINKVN